MSFIPHKGRTVYVLRMSYMFVCGVFLGASCVYLRATIRAYGAQKEETF